MQKLRLSQMVKCVGKRLGKERIWNYIDLWWERLYISMKKDVQHRNDWKKQFHWDLSMRDKKKKQTEIFVISFIGRLVTSIPSWSKYSLGQLFQNNQIINLIEYLQNFTWSNLDQLFCTVYDNMRYVHDCLSMVCMKQYVVHILQ